MNVIEKRESERKACIGAKAANKNNNLILSQLKRQSIHQPYNRFELDFFRFYTLLRVYEKFRTTMTK